MKCAKRLLMLLALIAAMALSVNALAAGPDLAAAKSNYMLFCAKCHGTNGKGDGPAAATLHTKPRNYTDCALMSKITDQTLFKAIKFGGASVHLSADMPSWKDGFSDDEIHGLVAYVRTFCGH